MRILTPRKQLPPALRNPGQRVKIPSGVPTGGPSLDHTCFGWMGTNLALKSAALHDNNSASEQRLAAAMCPTVAGLSRVDNPHTGEKAITRTHVEERGSHNHAYKPTQIFAGVGSDVATKSTSHCGAHTLLLSDLELQNMAALAAWAYNAARALLLESASDAGHSHMGATGAHTLGPDRAIGNRSSGVGVSAPVRVTHNSLRRRAQSADALDRLADLAFCDLHHAGTQRRTTLARPHSATPPMSPRTFYGRSVRGFTASSAGHPWLARSSLTGSAGAVGPDTTSVAGFCNSSPKLVMGVGASHTGASQAGAGAP